MHLLRTTGVLAVLLCLCSTTLNAQNTNPEPDRAELVRRLEALEKEVGELRAALATAYAPHAEESPGPAIEPVNPAPPPTLARLLGATTLSGLVDINYGHNFNRPQNRRSGMRSFDTPTDQFSLNLVELVVDRPPDAEHGRVGYHVALGFGEAMDAIRAVDPGNPGFTQYLKEGYVSYLAPLGSGLTVDFGKFVTPLGAEVIETKDNWNYSRGLLFSYAIPYYHFGGRVKYAFGSKYSIAGYVVNGWNNVVDNNSGKTVGVSFGWNPTAKLAITQNYMAGPEATDGHDWRQVSDTVVSYKASERLSLMLNYDYGHDQAGGAGVSWTGVGGYARYVFSPVYTVAGRYEYFNDQGGLATGMSQHLHEVTATFERVMAKNLITRFEFRRDLSSAPVFMKGSTPVNAQTTFAAGMVYAFDTRQAE